MTKSMTMCAPFLFMMCLSVGYVAAEAAYDDEFLGPFPTWYDLKRDFGAVGDGAADDTDALQKALDSVGRPEFERNAIWVPAGTYRITRTLVRTDAAGIFLIGEHPDTTILRWDGPAYAGEPRVPHRWLSEEWMQWNPRHQAEMLWFNGRNSRFERITFDGAGKAAAGFSFKWHGGRPEQTPSHRNSLADMVFKDMAIGFNGGGKLGTLDSEVLIERCRFIRCSQFGVGLHHFNSVNYWIWHCSFVDCGVGVSNEPKPHGGAVHIYESVFLNSREADFTIFHSGAFGLRHNYSEGSRRFIHAKDNEVNGALMHVQGNVIVNTIESEAVLLETLGNVQFTDNIFISRADAAGPVVRASLAGYGAPVAVSAVGNTFTVENSFRVDGQLFELDTRVADRRELLARVEVPTLPGVPPRHNRTVFAVAAGADDAAIQQAIDQAVRHAAQQPDSWPVVHLPHGRYSLNNTVVIPAGARIQIAGDGLYTWGDGPRGTVLAWTGAANAGPAIRIEGPAKARLRDFGILSRTRMSAAILAENVDQEGGRIHLRECNISGSDAWQAAERTFGTGMIVDGLDHTQVQAIAHEGTGISHWNRQWDGQEKTDPDAPYPVVRVIGGPLARAGQPVPGVIVQGGNTGRWDVRDGGKLVVRDCWYESNWAPFHMILRGTGRITLDGGYDAQYTHPNLKGAGVSYAFTGWSGRFTLVSIGGHYNAGNPVLSFTGNNEGSKALFIGNCGDTGTPRPEAPRGGQLVDVNRRAGSVFQPNAAETPAQMVLDLLEDTRTARVQPLVPTPDGSTDLRLSRVWTRDARIGLHLFGTR